jgi:hypothetical protein
MTQVEIIILDEITQGLSHFIVLTRSLGISKAFLGLFGADSNPFNDPPRLKIVKYGQTEAEKEAQSQDRTPAKPIRSPSRRASCHHTPLIHPI